MDGKEYIKDLELFICAEDENPRNLKTTIMIDSDMCSYTFHVKNGLYIEPFDPTEFDDDTSLELLQTYLLEIADEAKQDPDGFDVRKRIKNDFNLVDKIENHHNSGVAGMVR